MKKNHNIRKYVVEKQNSSTTYEQDESTYTHDNSTSFIQDSDSYIHDTETQSQSGGGNMFKSIVDVDYKKPKSGTRQDNMGTDEIKKKLEGFIPLQNMQEKKLLTTLPLFKTWVRYINKDTRQFRTGGLLMKVEYPDYIMLVNTNKSLTWSVQLNNNILFIRDPKLVQEEKRERERENVIKNKLYEMYKAGNIKGTK